MLNCQKTLKIKCEMKESGEKVKELIARLCLILCDPMDRSPPGSSVHSYSQRILEWVAISFSRGSS